MGFPRLTSFKRYPPRITSSPSSLSAQSLGSISIGRESGEYISLFAITSSLISRKSGVGYTILIVLRLSRLIPLKNQPLDSIIQSNNHPPNLILFVVVHEFHASIP